MHLELVVVFLQQLPVLFSVTEAHGHQSLHRVIGQVWGLPLSLHHPP